MGAAIRFITSAPVPLLIIMRKIKKPAPYIGNMLPMYGAKIIRGYSPNTKDII